MKIYDDLKRIAEIEFAGLVDFAELLDYKLRIYFKDKSFADIWFSLKIKGRFSYHWERGSEVFRHDNMPHPQWEKVSTFPKHFHNGDQENVDRGGGYILHGFVTERDWGFVDQAFPGAHQFFRHLPIKPRTFLDLLWLFHSFGPSTCSGQAPSKSPLPDGQLVNRILDPFLPFAMEEVGGYHPKNC